MVTKRAAIKNKNGIHVRPSQEIAASVSDYMGFVQIETAHQIIYDANTISIISLGLIQGDTVYITIEGPEEEAICSRLAGLFEKEFDFPPRK
ncbi:MAG: HPr family phosphocarrier protein [Spirochaetales bacterium]|jgi:phosphotransferase system HPr (HPr) family protein|nr:HPr family phosphocarrier protein [Spirochaetales bacterium]